MCKKHLANYWCLFNTFIHIIMCLFVVTRKSSLHNSAAFTKSTAEIYNSTTHRFTSVESMKYRRGSFTLTLLPSGKVLATGGIDWTTYTFPVTCELYDPITQTWSNTQTLNNGRSFHRSVLLNDSVLTIAGYNFVYGQFGTCEKYKL